MLPLGVLAICALSTLTTLPRAFEGGGGSRTPSSISILRIFTLLHLEFPLVQQQTSIPLFRSEISRSSRSTRPSLVGDPSQRASRSLRRAVSSSSALGSVPARWWFTMTLTAALQVCAQASNSSENRFQRGAAWSRVDPIRCRCRYVLMYITSNCWSTNTWNVVDRSCSSGLVAPSPLKPPKMCLHNIYRQTISRIPPCSQRSRVRTCLETVFS